MSYISPPKNENELLERAYQLSGLTLGEIALRAKIAVPENLLRDKGWGGQLMELVLGATAGSLPIPDFPELDIELKTLPIDRNGKPLETTFICVAPLTNIVGQQWRDSGVYRKMKRVLWVPILAEREIAVTDRVIGMPFIWSPNDEQEKLLRDDWEEIMDKISLGEIKSVNARLGQVMQLRPKAANSSVVTDAVDAQGRKTQALPRGFYLKIPFTHSLLMSS